jgi:AcrR family transcriptional regulator
MLSRFGLVNAIDFETVSMRGTLLMYRVLAIHFLHNTSAMSKTQKIVEAARKRFRHYGIGKTTMQEIAADAGVAVGTLYLYFGNKDDLVVACAGEFVERHHRQAAAILADDTTADQKLRNYATARFRESKEIRTNSRHAIELARAVLRVKPDRIHEEGMMMSQTISAILRLGVRNREFRIANVEEDAHVFLCSIAWFFSNALAPPPIEPTEKDLLSVVNWFIKAWKGTREKARATARRARPSAR